MELISYNNIETIIENELDVVREHEEYWSKEDDNDVTRIMSKEKRFIDIKDKTISEIITFIHSANSGINKTNTTKDINPIYFEIVQSDMEKFMYQLEQCINNKIDINQLKIIKQEFEHKIKCHIDRNEWV